MRRSSWHSTESRTVKPHAPRRHPLDPIFIGIMKADIISQITRRTSSCPGGQIGAPERGHTSNAERVSVSIEPRANAMVRYSMTTSGVFLLVGAHMQASRCPQSWLGISHGRATQSPDSNCHVERCGAKVSTANWTCLAHDESRPFFFFFLTDFPPIRLATRV